MKKIIVFVFLYASQSMALNCFPVGEFEGKGFFEDSNKLNGTYSVKSQISSSTQAATSYSWSTGQSDLSYTLKDDLVYVNGSSKASGKAKCGFGSLNIELNFYTEGQDRPTQLTEEWLTVGNYLIRNGKKSSGKFQVFYQELMIRKN